MADDLSVGLGDRMTIDVQGLPLETKVVHLREVDWSRFNLNFFMLFPNGVLEDAPGFHVVTSRIPDGRTSGELQAAVASSFQNVSVIDLTAVLETVRGLLGRIAQAVQVLSLFTVGAGLCILVGIFLNGREQRTHEAVLLRTLGATTRQLRTIFRIEFGVLGLLAAVAGVGLAVLAYYPAGDVRVLPRARLSGDRPGRPARRLLPAFGGNGILVKPWNHPAPAPRGPAERQPSLIKFNKSNSLSVFQERSGSQEQRGFQYFNGDCR